MAEIQRYCSSCSTLMPPNWNQPYCPLCGGRVKVNIVQRPRQEKRPGQPREKREEWAKVIAYKKFSNRGNPQAYAGSNRSMLGPRFWSSSPAALFLASLLTLGIRPFFWVKAQLPSLVIMAKADERIKRSTLQLWAAVHGAALLFLLWGTAEWFFLNAGRGTPLECGPFRLGCIAMVASFLIGRYILMWVREVVMDDLERNEKDAVRAKARTFAPAPLGVWFLGPSYLQANVNRMIQKKALRSFGKIRKQGQNTGEHGIDELSDDK